MRFIDLKGNPPPQALIDEGVRLTEMLKAISDPEERKTFIDKNAKYWGKLKSHLESLSHNKCWYSEAKELVYAYHVDHFRPKNAIKSADKKCESTTINNTDSYWWLAFDWENYRLSGHLPNSNKNAYFPLRTGSQIATCKEECESEDIALLDPTDEDDCIWLGYTEDGNACAACENNNSWEAQRANISIVLFNLNTPNLIDARKEIQNKCKLLISDIEKIHHDLKNNNNPLVKAQLKAKIKELRDKTKATEEFSSVAKNYILNHPEQFIKRIAS